LNQQWSELRFLYIQDGEVDQAAQVMINHSAEAWDHQIFRDTLQKVHNTDICYRGIQFYFDEHPKLVVELLVAITAVIDPARVIQLVKKMNQLPLIKPWLVSIQDKNVAAVNDAVNELYIEEEDYEGLRASIEHFNNFEQIKLASQLEKHDLLEFRRISSYVYQLNNQFDEAIEISKRDKLYRDAITAAAASKKTETAEDLLRFFCKEGFKECFGAAIYTCYDIVRPDVVLELAFRNEGFLSVSYPFFVQVVREYITKVDDLVKEKEKRDKNAAPEQAAFQAPEQSVLQQIPQIGYYDPNQMPPQMQQQQFGGQMQGQQFGGQPTFGYPNQY